MSRPTQALADSGSACTRGRARESRTGLTRTGISSRSMPDDTMDDFDRVTFTHDGKTRTVFRQGTGPAVIVIAEIPGITPKVLEFARRVSAIGCTAHSSVSMM